MREPDSITECGDAVFGWVQIDPLDGSALIDVSDDLWIDHDGLREVAKDATDAITWYEARKAEGK